MAPLCFRLRPFTSYKLRLKATNDIGDSDFSAETDAVTTLQDGEPAGTQAGVRILAPSQLPPWDPETWAPKERGPAFIPSQEGVTQGGSGNGWRA